MADEISMVWISENYYNKDVKIESSEDWSKPFEEVTVTKTEVMEQPSDSKMIKDKANCLVMEQVNVPECVLLTEDEIKIENDTESEDFDNSTSEEEDSEENDRKRNTYYFQSNKAEDLMESYEDYPYESKELLEKPVTERVDFTSSFPETKLTKIEKPFECTYKTCECSPFQKQFCSCNTCGFLTAKQSTLRKHILRVHGEKKYKCISCEYSTNRRETLINHVHIHADKKPFKCDICEYGAAQAAQLKNHIITKHNDKEKKYKCEECKYATHIKASFVSHLRIHTNERPFRCNICEYVALRKNQLKMHISTKHEGKKPFKCTYKECKCNIMEVKNCNCNTCEFSAVSRNILEKHVLIEHTNGEKKYKCTHCEYSTNEKASLINHVRTHTNEKPFKCDICEYAAAQAVQVKNHMLTKHSNKEKKYKCGICNYATHIKGSFTNHLRIHTNEEPLRCNLCDFVAIRKNHLRIHLLTEHGGKELFKCTYKKCKCTPIDINNCNCNTCEFSAINKSTLEGHILRVHSNEEKLYKCTHCGYSTNGKGNLINHVRIHASEKPFKCGMCEYAAAQGTQLKNHILSKHSDEEKKYKCEDCNYATHVKASFVCHLRIHNNDRPFTCDMCKFAGIRKCQLEMHILTKHGSGGKMYKCDECKYSTNSHANLLRHQHVHTNKKPFKCDICDFEAAQKTQLKHHMLKKHSDEEKQYKCQDCTFSSHVKAELMRHIRIHANIRPFKCDMCEFTAVQSSHLKNHTLSKHSDDEKKYKCGICTFSTHRKANLIYHIYTHTNTKSFKCDECDFAAIQKRHLKNHVLTKHRSGENNIGSNIADMPLS